MWARWSGIACVAALVMGCAPSYVICLDDFDGDGLCGSDDPCPVDQLNDEDEDGICGSEDICAEGDDAVDNDLDGVPNACDACDDDPYNDPDEDGICTLEDACPDGENEGCMRSIWLGLQVDYFAGETTWRLTDEAGNPIDAGTFDAPGAGVFRTYEIPIEAGAVCIDLHDDFGDGGVHGVIWDDTFGVERLRWDAFDWRDDYHGCFEITGGLVDDEAEPTISEADYLDGLDTCTIILELNLIAYAQEVSWNLGTAARREVASVTTGTYQGTAYREIPVEVWDGNWVFVMRDSFGDGWDQGGTVTVRYATGGEPIAEGSLPGGYVGTVPFEIDCP